MTISPFEIRCIADYCREHHEKHRIKRGFVEIERNNAWERLGTVAELLDIIADDEPRQRIGRRGVRR